MPFKAHKMAPTFVNATLNILSKPKSSPGIDPSQSNYLSSKMSLHIYGKSDFVNPENIAAFLAFFQQIRTHPRTIIVLRSRGEKTVLKTSLAGTKYCVTMIAILIPTASWQIRLVITGGDYEAGGSVQRCKHCFLVSREKKQTNKTRMKCLIATLSVILLVHICKQNNVKVVMKLCSHCQLRIPYW